MVRRRGACAQWQAISYNLEGTANELEMNITT